MTLIGVDGCRAGWVVAEALVDLTEVRFYVVRSAEELFTKFDENTFAAIDIPIRLPANAPRACDLEARQVLRPHGSRVFPAPSRAALGATSYRDCCALNDTALGVLLSKQSHAILAKIREVDAVMFPGKQSHIREAHPEVTFRTLAEAPLKHPKKTTAGLIERLDILQGRGLRFEGVSKRSSLEKMAVAMDDVLDAAACLLTAHRIANGEYAVLGRGQMDQRGLRMEIVA